MVTQASIWARAILMAGESCMFLFLRAIFRASCNSSPAHHEAQELHWAGIVACPAQHSSAEVVWRAHPAGRRVVARACLEAALGTGHAKQCANRRTTIAQELEARHCDDPFPPNHTTPAILLAPWVTVSRVVTLRLVAPFEYGMRLPPCTGYDERPPRPANRVAERARVRVGQERRANR